MYNKTDKQNLLYIDSLQLILLCLFIQLSLFGIIGLNLIGIDIPFLRIIFGFLYLTFLPGVLILGKFRFNKLTVIEVFLYSIGLSFFFLMFIGMLINFLYPFCGIEKPISEVPLVITFSILTLALTLICYSSNKKYTFCLLSRNPCKISLEFFLVLMIPFLFILGTYFINFYNSNVLSIVSILFTIIIIFGLLKKNRFDLFPFAIWVISLSFMFHWSLITMYIPISDGTIEYYFSNMVIKNGIWDYAIDTGSNSLLSVVILNPIYCHICNIPLTWVYKLILPTLMSFVPIGLYNVYNKYYSEDISFISCIFFFTMYSFFSWIALAMKHVTAYIFVVLIFTLLTNKSENDSKKSLLLIIFTMSLIVSHYGISYLFILTIFTVLLLSQVNKLIKKNFLAAGKITNTYMILCFIFAISWYMYTSNSNEFNIIVNMGYNTVTQVLEFSVESSRAYAYIGDSFGKPLSLIVRHFIYYTLILFEGVGVFYTCYKYLNKKIVIKEYLSIAIVSFLMLFSIFLPFFTINLSIDRIFNFTAIFLAPFCINGLRIIIRSIMSATHVPAISKKNLTEIVSIYFLVFILFETGIVSGLIVKDYYFSSALSQKDIMNQGTTVNKNSYYSDYMISYDVYCANWLSLYKNPQKRIFADFMAIYPLITYGEYPFYESNMNITLLKPYESETYLKENDSYFYLRYSNVVDGIMAYNLTMSGYNTTVYSPTLKNRDLVYSNGGCLLYK